VRVCTGYRADGREFDDFPPHQSLFHRAEPAWEELPGWEEDLREAASFQALPPNARAYVRRVEELCGVRVSVVSVGPAREQSLPVG
jgi:adenylosuccinate synthase